MTNLHFEILTPCFCAGSDQAQAELRAPAVRGQLRWWFRVLGGTPEQEKRVFGGVHGNFAEDTERQSKNVPQASAVVVRITDYKAASTQNVKLPLPNQSLYYLFHFAKASAGGLRYTPAGWLAPQSTFTLFIGQRRRLPPGDQKLLESAIQAFAWLGSLGLRQTRGLGSLGITNPMPTHAEFAAFAKSLAPSVRVGWIMDLKGNPCFTSNSTDWRSPLGLLESAMRQLRRQYPEKKGMSPLGSSAPRQSSAVHLRVVSLREGLLPVILHAPGILDRASDKPLVLGKLQFPHPYSPQVAGAPTHVCVLA